MLTTMLLFAGCATTGGESGSSAGMASLLQQAQELNASGAREKAVAVLEQAARENPGHKEPWLRIAQIQFEASQYPLAMQAAQEALARDPLNQEAKSMLIVAGLRVSARAMAELRSENALSGTTRNEAEKLAKSLRETLGEPVLVPTPTAERAAVREQPAKARLSKPASRATSPVRKSQPDTKPLSVGASGATSTGGSSKDPFGALR